MIFFWRMTPVSSLMELQCFVWVLWKALLPAHFCFYQKVKIQHLPSNQTHYAQAETDDVCQRWGYILNFISYTTMSLNLSVCMETSWLSTDVTKESSLSLKESVQEGKHQYLPNAMQVGVPMWSSSLLNQRTLPWKDCFSTHHHPKTTSGFHLNLVIPLLPLSPVYYNCRIRPLSLIF